MYIYILQVCCNCSEMPSTSNLRRREVLTLHQSWACLSDPRFSDHQLLRLLFAAPRGYFKKQFLLYQEKIYYLKKWYYLQVQFEDWFGARKWYQILTVTKTRNGMERNGAERSVIFWLLTNDFRFKVRDTQSKLLWFRESYCMASGWRTRKKMGRNNPFCSISFWV